MEAFRRLAVLGTEVQDTGTGLAPPVLENVFEPFVSTKFLGRGLGLPAVLGIVRSHRGAVRIQGRPGGGSTVAVHLPVLPA